MPSISRRKALQLGGTSITVGLTGCTSILPTSQDDPRLVELGAGNHDPEAHVVYVLLVTDGEPVYWNRMALAPHDSDGDSDGDSDWGEFDGYPTEPGSFLLYVWRDGQARSDWQRIDFREHDASCLGITIQIGDPLSDRGEVSVYSHSNCRVGNETDT
ncbi:hypothetical protein [Haloarchaeobius sp. HRN-SO-5]|uniref:hypothetical protein n=1 Tax=Haloarchaeobius sp. HRN-SO-5 TaxID=3446118 RepID=UPI003EBC38F3